MKKFTTVAGIIIGILSISTVACSEKQTGEQLFQLHCAACHAGGENKIKPEKTLHSAILKANGITKPEDIVNIMRNPGLGMRRFDENTVSDKDAKKIAGYILKTF